MADPSTPDAGVTPPPGSSGMPAQQDYPITVRGPDGQIHGFPAGASREQIGQYLRSFYLPSSTPAAGSATPSAGAVMPGSRTIPGYTSDEDWNNIALATALGEKNRGVIQAIQNTPGHQYRTRYQQDIAKNQAALEERQRAGKEAVLPGIHDLHTYLAGVNPNEWRNSFGEYNAQTQPAASEVPLNYKAWRAPDMPPVQARAAYGLMSGPAEQRQFGIYDRASHLVEAATESAIGASNRNLGGSDARMELVKSMLQKALLAPDKATALDIIDDAEDISRGVFNLPKKPGGKNAPYRVTSPDLAAKLPKGSHYMTPDGKLMRIPY